MAMLRWPEETNITSQIAGAQHPPQPLSPVQQEGHSRRGHLPYTAALLADPQISPAQRPPLQNRAMSLQEQAGSGVGEVLPTAPQTLPYTEMYPIPASPQGYRFPDGPHTRLWTFFQALKE